MIANTGTAPNFCSHFRVKICDNIKVKLEKNPNLLMLHVNCEKEKDGNRFLKYGDTLDVSAFVESEEKDSIYDLKAVAYEDESSVKDHYVADVRVGQGNWSRADGFIRKPIQSEEALKRQASILFYEKRNVTFGEEEDGVEAIEILRHMEDVISLGSSSSSCLSELEWMIGLLGSERSKNSCGLGKNGEYFNPALLCSSGISEKRNKQK
ncbi:unnamed protein product [Agarophyton chilense]